MMTLADLYEVKSYVRRKSNWPVLESKVIHNLLFYNNSLFWQVVIMKISNVGELLVVYLLASLLLHRWLFLLSGNLELPEPAIC